MLDIIILTMHLGQTCLVVTMNAWKRKVGMINL